MTLNGELGVGRHSEFDNNFLKAILVQNPRQARDIARRMCTSQSTVCRHLEKLGKVFKLGVWVFHNLSERKKDDRMAVATSLLSSIKQKLFLERIITGDEKWISNDNISIKYNGLIKIKPTYQIRK